MTRAAKNRLCWEIWKLHGYCKRRFNPETEHWECVECEVEKGQKQ